MNAKVDQKNLTFGINKSENLAKKCRQIHTGYENKYCPTLKANYANIPKCSDDKYLGDIVSSDGKMEKTIKMRESKGFGASNQIMNILKNVSLGNHYFQMAILLRNAAFVNKILKRHCLATQAGTS